MKKYIKSLAILLLIIFTVVGCSKKMTLSAFPSVKDSDYVNFPLVEWGMSYSDTLKNLNINENEVEIIEFTDENKATTEATLVHNIILGGQTVSLWLIFSSEEINEKVGFDMGLIAIRMFCYDKAATDTITKQLLGGNNISEDYPLFSFGGKKTIEVISKELNIYDEMLSLGSRLYDYGEDVIKNVFELGYCRMTRILTDQSFDFDTMPKKMRDEQIHSIFIYDGKEISLINHLIK